MARFLSQEWLDDLDAALRAHDQVADLTRSSRLVVEQRVGGPDQADVVYHLVFDHGRTAVQAGPATDPTVTFSQGTDTARAIATGTESAQRAFMTGALRVGGDLQALLAHQDLLTQLDDVFAGVRAATDFGVAPGG